MYYVTMIDRFMSGWGPAAGKINRMVVEPKYRGKSVVPSAIVYICSGEGEGKITMTINVW